MAAGGVGSPRIRNRQIRDEHDEPSTMVRRRETDRIGQIEGGRRGTGSVIQWAV